MTGAPDSPADDIEEIDPALARERTDLAWTRTAISFAAVGAAIIKFRPVVGLPLMIMAVVIWRLDRLPGQRGTRRAHDLRLLLVTLTVTTISVIALVLSFAGQAHVLPR